MKIIQFLILFLVIPIQCMAVSLIGSGIHGTNYVYYGHPGSVQGTWSGYGVAYVDRVYVHSETAISNGTVDAINLYLFTIPGGAYSYACVYNYQTLIGKVDISGITATGWTGYLTVMEESTNSLNYVGGDYLNAGMCIDGTGTVSNAVENYLGEDSGDSGNLYYNTDSWATNPPSSLTWQSSSHSGLGVRLRCIE